MMNSSSSGSELESNPSLDNEQFAALFPFFLQFDRDLRILDAGPSLRKACPDVIPGKLLPKLFSLERPRIPLTAESLAAAQGSLFLLKHLGSGFCLRAQLWVNAPGGSFFLLGSPWIRQPGALAEWNLALADFAIHDSTPELVQSSVSHQLALDDLRRLTAKLQTQRTELRQALESIREGDNERQLLARIVSRSADAVAVTDPSGKTEWVNASFTRLTGYSIDEMRGIDPVLALRGSKTDAGKLADLSAALRAGRPFQCLLGSYRKDGQFFWNDLDLQPVSADDGAISNCVYVLSDVTGTRLAATQNDLASRISCILAESIDSRQAELNILRTICEAVGACYGGLWWIDAQRRSLELSQFCAAPEIENSAFLTTSQASAFGQGQGLPGRVWLQNTAVSIPDIEHSFEWTRKALAIAAGLRAGVAFPIRISGATYGVIEIFSLHVEDLGPVLLPLAESLGVQIGQFIERRNADSQRDRFLSLLQSALDSTPDGVVITDLDGAAVQSNASWLGILGDGDPGDSTRWWQGFVGNFREAEAGFADWTRLRSLTEQLQSACFEMTDGRIFETTTTPHRHDGRMVGQVWVFRDVTTVMAQQRERERLVATLNSTLESTTDGILVTGLDTERIMFNQRFLDMWHIPREVAESNLTVSIVPLLFPQLKDPDTFLKCIESLFQNSGASATESFEFTDGRVFELFSQPQRVADRIIGRVWCYRDVTFEWTAHRALAESEQRYRSVAETAPDAIFTFDTSGSVQFANRNAIDLFGGSARTLNGSSVASFFPVANRESYTRLFRQLVATDFNAPRRTIEVSLLDASGRIFPAEVTIGQSRRGEAVQFIAFSRDISQRKEAEEQIRRSARSADLANRAKSAFLANISHEIRTPLNSIVGLTELLRGSRLPGEVQEAVDSIWISAESLLALINDLIDISKIEAGQVDVESQDFDAAEVAERAIDVLRIRAAAKSLDLYLIIEPSAPPPLRGDANRIRQVLVNLLSNAVKFTEGGSITLSLHWEPDGANIRLSYSITDTGIGIAPADQQRIFESFYRAQSKLTVESGGAGLGLGISRAIATRLGGSITVESAPGKGSCFHFTVPATVRAWDHTLPAAQATAVLVATLPERMSPVLAVVRSTGFLPCACPSPDCWPADAARFQWVIVDEEWSDLHGFIQLPHPGLLWLRMTGRAADLRHSRVVLSPLTPARLRRALLTTGQHSAAPTAPGLPDLSGHILLVEDNPAGQRYLKKLLTSNGLQVEVAASATEAYHFLRSSAFHLVLMDLQLPDGSGLDVLRELRTWEKTEGRARTPVIVVSAHALSEFQAAALAAGADDYISKPVRPGVLLESVRRWLLNSLRTVVIAQSTDLLAGVLQWKPDAAGVSIPPDGAVLLPADGGPFDVAVLIARSPTPRFLQSALAALAPFPGATRILLGEDWPVELIGLAGGGSVFPVPASAAEFDRLMGRSFASRNIVSNSTPTPNLTVEIAALARDYLTGVRASLSSLRRDLEEGRPPEIADFAHRLKGTGAAYGFPVLTTLATKLETAAVSGDRAEVAACLSELENELLTSARRTEATR